MMKWPLAWSSTVRKAKAEIQQLHVDLSAVRESCRTHEADSIQAQQLSALAKESSAKATDALLAERSLSAELAQQLGNAKTALEKSQEAVASLESRVNRHSVEIEKLKAELARKESELALARLNEEKEKHAHHKTKGHNIGLLEWIFKTHHLAVPPQGIRAMFTSGARLSAILILLLPILLTAQIPPPFWRNAWTTNVPPAAVRGQNNLSITNLGTGTNWQFFNVGPKTVARLGDVTNIVGAATGDAGGTNARQFGTLALTNLSGNPIPFTNIIAAATAVALGTNSGITYITNTMNTNAFQPASENLTNWSNIPTGSMANAVSTDFLTNWANAISNLTRTKQNGGAVLTNLVGTVARNVTNVVSLNTTNATSKPLTNSYSTGVLTLYGLEQGSGLTISVNASNIVYAADWAQIASTTNVVGVSNLVNTKQNGDSVLTNLVGTVARNVTNVVSLSTSNATSHPITNSYASGVLTLFGIEQGANITLTQNGSNIVIASTASGGDAGGTNSRQFGSATLTNLSNNPYKDYTNAIWTNINGTIRPSTANPTNQLYFPSATLNNGVSNTMVVVSNSNFLHPFTNAFLRYYNSDTNFLTIDTYGKLNIGAEQNKQGELNDFDINIFRVVDQGESSKAWINIVQADTWPSFTKAGEWWANAGTQDAVTELALVNPATSANQNWAWTLNTNFNSTTFTYNYNNNDLVRFSPAIASGFVDPVYLTDTKSTILSGNLWAWRNNGTNMMQLTRLGNLIVKNTNDAAFFKISGGVDRRSILRTDDNTNIVDATIGTGLTFDGTTLSTSFSGLATNASQFGASTTLSIKEGALLTNITAWPSNVTGPSLIVNAKPGIGTNIFEIRNTNDQPVIFSSTNNGITLVASNLAILGPQTNTERVNILGGVTNWAGFQVKGITDHAGAVTNESRMDSAGGVTNWVQSETKGTQYASSNLWVKAGQSTSNAWVGGIVFFSTGKFTNLNAASTMSNLANVSIPGNTLTNSGDAIHALWSGVFASTLANTNQFQIVYGGTTILDTGLQTASNCNWRAECWITRTGNATEHVEGRFEWGPGGGVPFAFTNANSDAAAENNGIANTLALKGGSRRVGAHTNNHFRVWYEPGLN